MPSRHRLTPFEPVVEARGFNTMSRARECSGPYLGLRRLREEVVGGGPSPAASLVGFMTCLTHRLEAMYDPKETGRSSRPFWCQCKSA